MSRRLQSPVSSGPASVNMMDWVYKKVWRTKENLLNTLAMSFVLGMFYLGPLASILMSTFLLFSPLSPLLLLYFVWIYLDRKTAYRQGRRLEFLRSAKLHQRFRDYFPMSLIKTADIPPTKKYIFGIFPHGILGIGAHGQFSGENPSFQKLFPGINILSHTLNSNFYFPFSREYVISLGFRSVSKEGLVNSLSKGPGTAVAILPGGSAEAMLCQTGVHKVVLKSRKGFVKLAITTGADLVPIYIFGENELYIHYMFAKDSFIYKIQEAFRKVTGVAPTLASGRGFFQSIFGILPFKRPLYTVVGKPISVEKKENPTTEEITALHTTFTEELVNLFEKYKYNYLPNPDSVFLVVE
nr:diacylglycerol O-acyltransferase 1 [Halyomorpha halys]